MYIDLNKNQFCYDDECGDIEACGGINASTNIDAATFFYDENPVAVDGEWEMYEPATYHVCRQLADGTGWYFGCSNKHWYDYYSSKGPIYVFVNKNTGEKYASHPASQNWFLNTKDINLGEKALGEFLDEHPNFIINEFADLLKEYGQNGWSWDKEPADDSEFPGKFLSDIESSTDIDAATKTKYDAVRKLLGEDEWYYIEEYILNGDGKHSLEDIIFDEDAWDDYCDWKMSKFHKKAALSAATRIMAKRYLRGC